MSVGESPAALAGQAAEAVRALNHTTLPGSGGLAFPADAYDVTGALSVLVARLPQALDTYRAKFGNWTRVGRGRGVCPRRRSR